MNGKELERIIDQLYPKQYAESWDNVGVQIGTIDKNITSIMVSLDLTIEVINEAISQSANLIIVHHPVIFTPIKQIDPSTYLGNMISILIKHEITVLVIHTNFDVAPKGMNTILADKLHLNNTRLLDSIDDQFGLGILGEIKQTTILEFINSVKKEFNIPSVSFVGDLNQLVSTIAIVGGSGTSLSQQALEMGVDLFITGDVTYHKALDAKNFGLNILDIGHHFEVNGINELKSILGSHGVNIPIFISKVNTNPYQKI
jgi:dinuclear metal center YbgI/SA1388 family protein